MAGVELNMEAILSFMYLRCMELKTLSLSYHNTQHNTTHRDTDSKQFVISTTPYSRGAHEK